MGKKKGRSAKNAQKKQALPESEEIVKAPHSFVIFKGKIGKNVRLLMKNFRHVMEPYTATNLKIRKGNVIKDYISVAGLLNVTHLVLFSKSDIGVYLKIIRLPRGPTLTFKVANYSLTKDVMSSIKRHVNYAQQFLHHPLLVLNNFNHNEMHLKLLSTTFQNMFPSININNVKLNDIRRCVLLNYDKELNTVNFRHYTIKVVPANLNKSVKKLVQSKIPDLGRFEDVSEYIMRGGNLSESEGEQDGLENEVELPQSIKSRGNITSQQSSVRLIELGPRMDLQLVKIEEGVLVGEVIYHEFVKKTKEEINELKSRLHKKKREKEQRKRLQEANQRRKELQKEKNKKKSLEGMKKLSKCDGPDSGDDDKDEEWYKKEVGANPEQGLFSEKRKRKSFNKIGNRSEKYRKLDHSQKKSPIELKEVTKSSKNFENRNQRGISKFKQKTNVHRGSDFKKRQPGNRSGRRNKFERKRKK